MFASTPVNAANPQCNHLYFSVFTDAALTTKMTAAGTYLTVGFHTQTSYSVPIAAVGSEVVYIKAFLLGGSATPQSFKLIVNVCNNEVLGLATPGQQVETYQVG